MEKILAKNKLDDWVAALDELQGVGRGCQPLKRQQPRYQVSVPVMEDDIWSYQSVKGKAQLEHSNTVQPPKGFSFPQREVFFSFEQIKGEPPKLTQIQPKAASMPCSACVPATVPVRCAWTRYSAIISRTTSI